MDCPHCRAVFFWFKEKKSCFGGFLSIFFLFKMGAERENNARKRREWREYLMNKQWTLIAALIFTLIVAVFAVINVEPVKVDFLFGTAEWPLILVILVSVLMGALIIGSAGAFQIMRLKKELKALKREERVKYPELEAESAAPENQKD
ncbi:Lipopolysaccharide assembly protein A [Bacillus paralicheniformis]|nr:Lipopolysaccharide assembly protein A [Bacillus paralicheniformis]